MAPADAAAESALFDAIVYIVDDDPLVRNALTRMFRSLQ